MKFLGIIFLLFLSTLAVLHGETLIFEDNFDELNYEKWDHEINLSGGGNWEFQWYVNNRSNSYVRDGILYLKPTMTADAIGEYALHNGAVKIEGGAPSEMCTSNAFYGCERDTKQSGNIINPIRSARIRTLKAFNFKYGRVEVRAKIPKGDWIWPAIWMQPTNQEYSTWPVSGEIDIMESRGNGESYATGGSDTYTSTLHWGPSYENNRYSMTTAEYKNKVSLGDDFHTYGLYWTKDRLYTYIDSPNHIVLDVDFTKQSMWERGKFDPKLDNPWKNTDNAAPFNKKFYLILNVAVGGVNGYFPDGVGNKPWQNGQLNQAGSFWSDNAWKTTWVGEGSAMKIDSVKVWSFPSQ